MDDLMLKLAAGLASAPMMEEVEKEPPTIPEFPAEYLFGIVALSGILGLTLILIKEWRLGRILRPWNEITLHLKTGQNQQSALKQLKFLQIRIAIFQHDIRRLDSDWMMLTPSERELASKIIQGKAADEIATQMNCTTSHVYNLRSSIRKKWQLNTEEDFIQAIEERI